MSTKTTPHRFDVVGSFLRPEYLKAARTDFSVGKISAQELQKFEDKAIEELIRKEKKASLAVITDGEFRRATWHLDFMWGFNGVSHKPAVRGAQFHGEVAMLDETFLTGPISVDSHPFVEHFKFVKQFEDETCVAKQTMPSPAQFYKQMTSTMALKNTQRFYESTEELTNDIVAGYKKVMQDLYDVGCRNIQFDDCTWGMCVDESAPRRFGTDEGGLKKIMEQFLKINNLAIANKPEDMIINTHVCRGNFHSTWGSSGPYDKVADTLFEKENVNAYFLEFDDERSGGFAPLKYVSGDKKVVLGLITTKEPKLEMKADVIERIKDAAKYIPLDRLYLSPQCGFASCEIGNKINEDEQWNKIALVKEIAQEVWG